MDKVDWLDVEEQLRAAQQGEASKSAGKAGEGSQDVGKPTGAEGGALAPPDEVQNPPLPHRPRTAKTWDQQRHPGSHPGSHPDPPLKPLPRPLPKPPLIIPPLIQPRTWRMSLILQTMLKVIARQLRFGLTQYRIAKIKLTRHFTTPSF